MYSLLLVIIYIAFISLGLPDSLLGSAWPVMGKQFDVPLSYVGIVTMIIAGSTIVSSLMSDRLTRKLGAGLVTAISVMMTAVALFGFSISGSLIHLCLWAVPYGLGAGAVDAALNNYVALHYASRHMSWLHCFWGVGASISPFIMSYCLVSGWGWSSGYRSVAGVQIVLTSILFISLPLWKRKSASNNISEEPAATLSLLQALKNRGVKFVLIAFFGYCALEATTGLWTASYLVRYRGIGAETAARFASLFYLGITFGRFLCGFIAEKAGDKLLIRFGIMTIMIGIVLVGLPAGIDILALLGLVVIGFGCAPIYPSLIHSTPSNFGKENSQSIIGIEMASAYIGSTFMPPLFGLIADHINIGTYPFYLIFFAILMVLMFEQLSRVIAKNNFQKSFAENEDRGVNSPYSGTNSVRRVYFEKLERFMPRKTFITNMPDKAGAFLRASEIISKFEGNIVRVSYNKAVDLHTLFIDVEASLENLRVIERALCRIGYINENLIRKHVIEILIKIPDRPGAVLPVLKILSQYDINISYINSNATGEAYQNFKMGLLIENPTIVKTLLDEISLIYQINIIKCDSSEENLDNTVFYIRLANEMKTLLNLSEEKVMQFVSESNRILQELQADGEDAKKVFHYIRRFANFISDYRGEKFKVDIETLKLDDIVTLYSIQPYCGSNSYVFKTLQEYVIIDSGYAIYANEMLKIFKELFPDWESRSKRIYITHADVDHCGLLSHISNAKIIVNQKSADSLKKQANGLPDYRENTPLRFGYSKISRIISGYVPPNESNLIIFDKNTPKNHEDLIQIGNMMIGDLNFTIFEGSGGHLYGEMVYSCPKAGVIFTGDILVNIHGFSKERAEFNSLAPYLMKSVNIDSQKAIEMREQVNALIENISAKNGKPCIICGGHGPLSKLCNRKLINIAT